MNIPRPPRCACVSTSRFLGAAEARQARAMMRREKMRAIVRMLRGRRGVFRCGEDVKIHFLKQGFERAFYNVLTRPPEKRGEKSAGAGEFGAGPPCVRETWRRDS